MAPRAPAIFPVVFAVERRAANAVTAVFIETRAPEPIFVVGNLGGGRDARRPFVGDERARGVRARKSRDYQAPAAFLAREIYGRRDRVTYRAMRLNPDRRRRGHAASVVDADVFKCRSSSGR